jgi:hypothetical protein
MGVGASFPIITKRVGEGGTTSGIEVKRIQQMLVRTGHNPKSNVDGGWGKNNTSTTAKAWIAYQQSKGWIPNNYLDPTDPQYRLEFLASDAGVTMNFAPGIRSLSGVSVYKDICMTMKIPYGWGTYGDGTKMAWGFKDRPYAMVFTRPGGPNTADFDVHATDARALNCCSFANILLSLWSSGGIHASPYDASQNVGGDGQQIGERFGMSEVKNKAGKQGIKSLDELTGLLLQDRIYHMALCSNSTDLTTHHDVIVINQVVYQANTKSASPVAGAVYTKALKDQWDKMTVKHVRLFGPGPG